MPRTSSVVTLGLVDDAHDLAVVHDRDAVGQVEDVVDVVADEEDPDALALQLTDEVAHLRGLRRTQRRRRLVHDEDAGVEVDGPGDGDRLALPSRERHDRGREVGEVGVQAVHDLAGRVLHGPVVQGPPARRQLAAQEDVARGADVVGQRQRLVDGLDLEVLGVTGVADRSCA